MIGKKISDRLVSELSVNHLHKAKELASQDLKELISSDFLEGIIKGDERSRWNGIINVGLWKGEKKYIVHTSLEGRAQKARNVEGDKIKAYLTAKHVREILPENSRTAYTPTIEGHRVVYEDKERGVLTREIYVSYEPRHPAFNIQGITPIEYAYLLGRDIARFMFFGMTNMPRHIRPNFCNGSFKTCMIDLDLFDPRTFKWNPADLYPQKSLDYEILLENEAFFLEGVGDYFLNDLLPENIKKLNGSNRVTNTLKSNYLDGFVNEIRELKGNRTRNNIEARLSI